MIEDDDSDFVDGLIEMNKDKFNSDNSTLSRSIRNWTICPSLDLISKGVKFLKSVLDFIPKSVYEISKFGVIVILTYGCSFYKSFSEIKWEKINITAGVFALKKFLDL